MRNYTSIKSIDLTPEENELLQIIPEKIEPDGTWERTADAVESLLVSLKGRNAIPMVRLKVFSDPDFAEVGSRSIKGTFNKNGVPDAKIVRDPNFVKYLRYFIFGPNLPRPVIEETVKFFDEFMGTSGMLITASGKKVRSLVRTFNLNRFEVETEFFRLGVEIGLSPSDARLLRKAVMSTRP